jgi:hypothetical protein
MCSQGNEEGHPMSPWIKLGLVVGVFALLTAARLWNVDEVEGLLEIKPK